MVKNLPANAGDLSWNFGSGRSPGGGNGNPLQYSCLENPTDRGAWWATVHGFTEESDTTWQLNSNEQSEDNHKKLSQSAVRINEAVYVKVLRKAPGHNYYVGCY